LEERKIELLLEKLCEMLKRELVRAEAGLVEIPEGHRISERHRAIEVILQKLGYGGKRLYIPKPIPPEEEEVETLIMTDYTKGVDIFSRYYVAILKRKTKERGIEPKTALRILYRIRRELKEKSSV